MPHTHPTSHADYSRVVGTRDLAPRAAAREAAIEAQLLATFADYGFESVRVPHLEYLDLYHPERIGSELYHHLVTARLPAAADFPSELSGRLQDTVRATHDAALRPDFTAPLARMLVSRLLQADAATTKRRLPARWAYTGSVFRARDPRPQRLIEFRQAGVELLGASHPLADLEVLTLAVDAACRLKVPSWRLHLGHAALFRDVIALALGPHAPAEAHTAIAGGLVQAARIRARVQQGDQGFAAYLEDTRQTLEASVRDVLAQAGESADAPRVSALVEAEWPQLADPDVLPLAEWRKALPELYERLTALIWTTRHGLEAERAEAILDLARSIGPPDQFFATLRSTLDTLGRGTDPHRRDRIQHNRRALRQLITDLSAALDRPVPVVLTPAASRGIAYYTGITFEIHTPSTGAAYTDVCGGGRYDRLHRWLHQRAAWTAALRRGEAQPEPPPIPDALQDSLTGVGFAFGIDRVSAALAPTTLGHHRPDVYIVLQDEGQARGAFQCAAQLRRAGLSVWSELPDNTDDVRPVQTQLHAAHHAGGAGAHFALVFGGPTQATGHVVLKDLDARTQRTLPIADACAALLAARGAQP